jgi:prepilin-type processing-associated H-X9-DG protein
MAREALYSQGWGNPSWYARILPYIEQNAVYDSLTGGTYRGESIAGTYVELDCWTSTLDFHYNAAGTVLLRAYPALMVCPSHGGALYGDLSQPGMLWTRWRTCYAGNLGPGTYGGLLTVPNGQNYPATGDFTTATSANYPVKAQAPPFVAPNARPLTDSLTKTSGQALSAIVDGTSNTLLFSEVTPTRSIATCCYGDGMLAVGAGFTTYYTPNSIGPDYSYGGYPDDIGPGKPKATCIPRVPYAVIQQVHTARSYHPGGLNCALLDGSVRFVANTIPLSIWRDISLGDNGTAPSIP